VKGLHEQLNKRDKYSTAGRRQHFLGFAAIAWRGLGARALNPGTAS